uniref:Polycystic kidney disease protein 1-like 2 n=1 Tax=Cyprinodon variegatus TaxID=28743 RepID=A0A3Q2DBW4_CYPVA
LNPQDGTHVDINILLSLVEDIIKCQNNATGDFYSSSFKKDIENGLWGSPEKTFDETQKKTNNSRYLYKQLHHVEKELRLIGPSQFPNTSSYNRASQAPSRWGQQPLGSDPPGTPLRGPPQPQDPENPEPAPAPCRTLPTAPHYTKCWSRLREPREIGLMGMQMLSQD